MIATLEFIRTNIAGECLMARCGPHARARQCGLTEMLPCGAILKQEDPTGRKLEMGSKMHGRLWAEPRAVSWNWNAPNLRQGN